MKRIFLSIILLFSILAGYSQNKSNQYEGVLMDNGPLVAPEYEKLRYTLTGSKWNKTNLTYYIKNGPTNSLNITQTYAAIREAFNKWEKVSNLKFTQVYNANADLKLSFEQPVHIHTCTENFDAGVLAHAFAPPPISGIWAGVLHFNDSYTWSTTSSNGIVLTTVAAHEIGHLLGLSHSTDVTALMYPTYSHFTRSEIAYDDAIGIWALYGQPSINGSNYIPCSGTTTFTFPMAGTWTVSPRMQIVSGQGTSSITVSKKSGTQYSYTDLDEVKITLVGPGNKSTLFRKQSGIGALYPTQIVVPSPIRYYTTQTYSLLPSTVGTGGSGSANYRWTVEPSSGVTIFNQGETTVGIYFPGAGSYRITCTTTTSCGQSQVATSVYASQSRSLSIVNNTNKQVTLAPVDDEVNQIIAMKSNDVYDYYLYRIPNSDLAASGKISTIGGTLNFGNVSSGIYILRIVSNNTEICTYKIVL